MCDACDSFVDILYDINIIWLTLILYALCMKFEGVF